MASLREIAGLADEVGGRNADPAAAAARRVRGRRTAELATAVTIAEIHLEDAAVDEAILAAEQPLAVERARAGGADEVRVVDEGEQRTRHFRAFAAREVARLAPDGAAHRAAREGTDDRARGFAIENDRGLAGRDLARPELAQGAACRLFADLFGRLRGRRETAWRSNRSRDASCRPRPRPAGRRTPRRTSRDSPP